MKRYLLFMVLGITLAYPQQALRKTNVPELRRLSSTFEQQFRRQYNQAVQAALSKGWPVRQEFADGKVIEIRELLPSGRPLYVQTLNLNAAKTVSTSRVWPGGGGGFHLTGDGIIIGERDAGAVRHTHQEFGDRVIQRDDAGRISNHATHVAGTLVASGVQANAKGMAYEGILHAYDWNSDNSEMSSAAADGLSISNHSYGYLTGWDWNHFNDNRWVWWGDPDVDADEDYLFGFYCSHAQDWDGIAYNAPEYLIVVSAGNDRNDDGPSAGESYWIWENSTSSWVLDSTARKPDGNYDCISHTAIAKNVLTVGAVHDIPQGYTDTSDVMMSSFSSWGPADDGRIKPDIVGNGVYLYSSVGDHDSSYVSYSGTSMSSPNVAGSMALIRQYYLQVNGGAAPLASTLKALVIHTADEAGSTPGPDYRFGWGLLNTESAIRLIAQEGSGHLIEEITLKEGSTYQLSLEVDGTEPLKATLCWTDPPGTPPPASLDPQTPMLVNDLDLRLTRGNTTFFPWTLSPQQPAAAAATGDNTVDNVEQVLIASPTPGTYTLTVKHKGSLQGGYQTFSLVVSGIVSQPANPNAPANVVAGSGFDGMVPLTWDPPENAVTLATRHEFAGEAAAKSKITPNPQAPHNVQADTVRLYRIYRSTSPGGPYTFLASVDPSHRNYANNEDYIDTDVINETTYYYVVTAVFTDSSESVYSPEVSATPIPDGMHVELHWSQVSPVLDGVLESGEWDDAVRLDISASGVAQPVTLYMKNDNNYLYLAVDDPNNTSDTDFNEIGLYFDDDNNNTWDADSPSTEGNFWIDFRNGNTSVVFRPIWGSHPDSIHFESSISSPEGVSAAASLTSGHVLYEIRIDLRSSALTALPGEEIGLWMFNYDPDNPVDHYYGFSANWPYGSVWTAPLSYGKVKLKSPPQEPNIRLIGYEIDDDVRNQSIGNNDHQANPGEFLEVFLQVAVLSGSYNSIYAVPDSSADPYVHPNPVYFYDRYISHPRSVSTGDTVWLTDDFDFVVASSTPEGHVLTIPLQFYDGDGQQIGEDTLFIPVTGKDQSPPWPSSPRTVPRSGGPGEVFTFNVWTREAGQTTRVTGIVKKEDGTIYTKLTLHPTGNTARFLGYEYQAQFTVDIPADLTVDVETQDDMGNTGYFSLTDRLTTRPFQQRHKVLLVADDGPWNRDFSEVYMEDLLSRGIGFDIWRTWVRGPIGADTLNQYLDGVIIWYCGWVYPQLDSLERVVLAQFLDQGGRLFFNDQDLGYYLYNVVGSTEADWWYQNYMHARYIQDNVDLWGVAGVGGDPITDGMHLKLQDVYGGWWPSEIDPIAPATPIFIYNPADSIEGDAIEGNRLPRYADECTGLPNHSRTTPKAPRDTISSGTAGLKVDNGTFKVVYLAFGYETIADSAQRRTLLKHIVRWLNPQVLGMDANTDNTPLTYRLFQNYPNPFNPSTRIVYQIPERQEVRLIVYDVWGRRIAILKNGVQKAGRYEVDWKGTDQHGRPVATGIYLLQLKAGPFQKTIKMMLIK